MCNTERESLSLVCRYFRDILKEEGPKVVVINDESRIRKFNCYSTYEARRIEVPLRPIVLPSAEWPRQIFPALEVLVGEWPCHYLEHFLDYTSKAESIIDTYADERVGMLHLIAPHS